jgi:hypothetical protein
MVDDAAADTSWTQTELDTEVPVMKMGSMHSVATAVFVLDVQEMPNFRCTYKKKQMPNASFLDVDSRLLFGV